VTACLESLTDTLARPDVALFILDQASSDGTAEYIAAHSSAGVWNYQHNSGVAKGRQMMLEDADLSPIIVFLDSDVVVKDAGWLDKLAAALEPENVGIAGPAGSFVRWLPESSSVDYVPAPAGECDVLSGWCQAFKRELVQIGVALDLDYGKFWEEDSDFCMQIREAGWDVICTGDIGVMHQPAASGDTGNRQFNLERFFGKWFAMGLTKSQEAY